MRIEQTIATVARRLAVAEVREITVVDQFATALRLHLWQLRMSLLGMPENPGSDLNSLSGFSSIKPGYFGCKRRRGCQVVLATAGCSAGRILG